MQRIITGLDLGSSNVRASACRVDSKGNIELLGLETMPSRGMQSSNIINFNVACNDISEIIKRLEKSIKMRIRHVYATISGSGIQIMEAKGMIALSKKPRQIWQLDVDRCIKTAGMIKLPQDRQIVQKLVHSFYINEGDIVDNPIGLYSTKLGVKLYVVTAEIAKIKNLYKCVEHAGYLLGDVVFSASAIAESVLAEEHVNKNIALLDIGSNVTDIALFEGKTITFVDCVPKGAEDIAVSEKALTYFDEIKGSLGNREFIKVIITGGGALKENLLENAEKFFKVQCILGHTNLKWCLLDASNAVIHTASLGVVSYEAKRLISDIKARIPLYTAAQFIRNVLETYF